MATSQLTLYNEALRFLGQPQLSGLTDAVETRRLLDNVWDENARKHVLEQGNWNFATRARKFDKDTSVDPAFGFNYAFAKPSDWVRTVQLCSDEYFQAPLTDPQFVDEQSYWYSDIDPIYVRYVSSDTSYGYDLSLWPQSFIRYVGAYLGVEIAPRVIQARTLIADFEEKMKDRLVEARSKDALNEGVKFHPQGSWVTARRSGLSRNRSLRAGGIPTS